MKVEILPILRVLRHNDTRTDVVAAVEFAVTQNRQRIQIRIGHNDFLAWCGVDHFAGATMIDRVREKRNNLVDFDIEVISKGGFAAKEIADHAKRRFLDAIEQYRLWFKLLEDAGDFIGLQDRGSHSDEIAARVQTLDVVSE